MNQACPICHAQIIKGLEMPQRNRQHAKYDFSVLEVGESMRLPISQSSAASRLAAWQRSKMAPERMKLKFTTRKNDDQTTTIWRLA